MDPDDRPSSALSVNSALTGTTAVESLYDRSASGSPVLGSMPDPQSDAHSPISEPGEDSADPQSDEDSREPQPGPEYLQSFPRMHEQGRQFCWS